MERQRTGVTAFGILRISSAFTGKAKNFLLRRKLDHVQAKPGEILEAPWMCLSGFSGVRLSCGRRTKVIVAGWGEVAGNSLRALQSVLSFPTCPQGPILMSNPCLCLPALGASDGLSVSFTQHQSNKGCLHFLC